MHTRPTRTTSALLLAAAFWVIPSGCDDTVAPSGHASTPNIVVLGAETGVEFATAMKMVPGNYANSDVYATANGDHLKLTVGGPSPTKSRLAHWYKTGGGVNQTFDALAVVPTEIPVEEIHEPSLLKAQVGNAFVVETMHGAYVKGWLSQASQDTVTIEFSFVP